MQQSPAPSKEEPFATVPSGLAGEQLCEEESPKLREQKKGNLEGEIGTRVLVRILALQGVSEDWES